MAAKRPYVFITYVGSDSRTVRQIVDELEALGVETWADWKNLQAGDSWDQAIRNALNGARAVVFFISPTKKNDEVVADLTWVGATGIPVFAVLLKSRAIALPNIQSIHLLDASAFRPPNAARSTARAIAKALDRLPDTPRDSLGAPARDELAKALTSWTKGTEPTPEAAPTSVFLVHGHDEAFLREVVGFVKGLGIKPIVLREVEGAARSLFDRFFEFGSAARFAIVLLSADDMGASLIQFDEPNVGPKALKYRPRQNSILELGYFYGLLGWDKVFVLEKAPLRRYPDFERPSDLHGVVFDRYDSAGNWKAKVAQRLKKSGFEFRKKKAA